MTLTDQAWDHVIQQCSIPEIKVELLGVRPTTTGTIINPSSATNPSLTTNPPRTMRKSMDVFLRISSQGRLMLVVD